ncbi:MAG TPA: glycosyltransferase family 2 protein [Steroidobacteraceae bacterium]|nr:glycosyltransferase family 2 protein [Steroidobacteraceae bacterium]
MPTVSVCIATYRRNERLRAVLDDLARQSRVPDQIVVVDNDPAGGARGVIEEFRRAAPGLEVEYDIQISPNIASTRNRTVELAAGEWLAFIDDDERAPKEWLQRLLAAAETYGADGVLGPVEPQVPPTAPRWIRRGRFYDFAHQASGAPVPLNCMRFGNVLLRAERVRAEPGPFDPSFGLMPGEDGDLLVRLVHRGARIVWYEEAPVFEPIEAKRLSLAWLLQRAFGGGQSFARAVVRGRYRRINALGKLRFYLRALLQMMAAGLLAGLSWPLGRHHAAAWLIKASANFGKLSILWGWEHNEYARISSAQTDPSRV